MRYIDAELIPYVESENGFLDDFAYRYDINEIPTADVVPKSEVASTAHKCEDCAGCTQWECDCSLIEEHAKAEVAREIFAEIEFDIANLDFDREETRAIAIEGVIANAKKKYTEENV